jgi:hypothetical protein
MALIAAILEAAGLDMEDSEAEDDYAVLSTSEGLAVDLVTTHHMTPEGFPTFLAAWRPLDGERHVVFLHDASTKESRCRLWLKDALRR